MATFDSSIEYSKSYNVDVVLQNREKYYIFYFFSFFISTYDFQIIQVSGREWGRYDSLSNRQYGTDKFYWVLQLLDSKENFWDLSYNYILYIPDKQDIINYINFIDYLIFKDGN